MTFVRRLKGGSKFRKNRYKKDVHTVIYTVVYTVVYTDFYTIVYTEADYTEFMQ